MTKSKFDGISFSPAHVELWTSTLNISIKGFRCVRGDVEIYSLIQVKFSLIMYSHLEELLEQKKQALLKYRQESLFEEIEGKKKVKELYSQIKTWLEPLQKND